MIFNPRIESHAGDGAEIGIGRPEAVAAVRLPILLAIREVTPRRALFLGWLAGLTANAGGFYWIIGLLERFGGFVASVARRNQSAFSQC